MESIIPLGCAPTVKGNVIRVEWYSVSDAATPSAANARAGYVRDVLILTDAVIRVELSGALNALKSLSSAPFAQTLFARSVLKTTWRPAYAGPYSVTIARLETW